MEVRDTLELILAIYAVANIIARATPTKKDDKIVGFIGTFLNMLFLKSNTK